MNDFGVQLIRLTQRKNVLRVPVKGFHPQRATKRDHSRSRFDMRESAALIDRLAADETKATPISYANIL